MTLIELLTKKLNMDIFGTKFLIKLFQDNGLATYSSAIQAHILCKKIIGEWK